MLGVGLGIGVPVFYTTRIDKDEEDLEELRKLNRENFKETGEYLSDVRTRAHACRRRAAARVAPCADSGHHAAMLGTRV